MEIDRQFVINIAIEYMNKNAGHRFKLNLLKNQIIFLRSVAI